MRNLYYLYLFSKITKYIALVSLVITFFSDLLIFKLLCCFVFIDLALDFSVLKCSLLQIIGIFQVNHKFGDNRPSVDNYKSEVAYILPFNNKWVAVNGCFRKEYSHSWDIPTQRYAYDFIILDENGKSYSGEFNKCDSYYCYNKDILAPADGVVVKVVNNARDSLIFPKGRFFSRAKHIAGNYIVIQHAEREYSTLAHLKKDSITVKVGDVVSKGQRIAKCGNTGNSTEPHLHFQLQTDQSFYNSAGLPIQFADVCISKVANYEKCDPRPHMNYDQVLDGYITRGFAVENKL
jgi:hypothetical protein